MFHDHNNIVNFPVQTLFTTKLQQARDVTDTAIRTDWLRVIT